MSEFETLRVEVEGAVGRLNPRAPREAEPPVGDGARRDRCRGALVRHPAGREGGDRARGGPRVLGRRRPGRPSAGKPEGCRSADAADLGRAHGRRARGHECARDRPAPRLVRRRGRRARGGLRPARRRRGRALLDPRGRPRHPARLGRHPPPGARDRSRAGEGAGAHLPSLRRGRGEGGGVRERVVPADALEAEVEIAGRASWRRRRGTRSSRRSGTRQRGDGGRTRPWRALGPTRTGS